MKQKIYDIIAMRTASYDDLSGKSPNIDKTFEETAAYIRRYAQGRDIKIAHKSSDGKPELTAWRLAELLNYERVTNWGYLGTLLEFADDVIARCQPHQLLVLICHLPTLETVLQYADVPIHGELPGLSPYRLRLTVTQRLLREPIYELVHVVNR